MDLEKDEFSLLEELADIEIGRRDKRPLCTSCSRPVGVCWCKSLKGTQVSTSCKVIVLQHPHEEKRSLRTSPILQALIPSENYYEFKGKRFNLNKFLKLKELLKSSNNLLLYPGDNAIDLEDLPTVKDLQKPYNIFILDGTWQQAKSMFYRNFYLKDLCQVRISGNYISQYIIRTQPTEDALSTVEVGAIALSTLERNWSIYSTLIEPLKLICQYQMNHGAVKHHSKELLILTGNYKKPLGRRTFKKLKKCTTKSGDDNASEVISSQDKNVFLNLEEENIEAEDHKSSAPRNCDLNFNLNQLDLLCIGERDEERSLTNYA